MDDCRLMPRRRAKKKGNLILGIIFLGLLLAVSQPETLNSVISFVFHPVFILLLVGFILIRKNTRKTKVPQSKKTEPSFESSNRALDKHTDPKPDKWTIDLIRKLEWKSFEDLCKGYIDAKGYRAEVSRQGADGGIDIFLYKDNFSQTQPFGIIQCKAWNSYKVGVKPLRELFGVMAAEKAPLGVFITSGEYTDEALLFSQGKPLKLLTGQSLLELIESLPQDKQQRLLDEIASGDYTTPSCPSCGTKMVQRKSSKGTNKGNIFWGCSNYPKCRNTLKFKQ